MLWLPTEMLNTEISQWAAKHNVHTFESYVLSSLQSSHTVLMLNAFLLYQVLLYTAVSSELAQATKKDEKAANKGRIARGILQKSKSMTVQNFVEEIRWMKVRIALLFNGDVFFH